MCMYSYRHAQPRFSMHVYEGMIIQDSAGFSPFTLKSNLRTYIRRSLSLPLSLSVSFTLSFSWFCHRMQWAVPVFSLCCCVFYDTARLHSMDTEHKSHRNETHTHKIIIWKKKRKENKQTKPPHGMAVRYFQFNLFLECLHQWITAVVFVINRRIERSSDYVPLNCFCHKQANRRKKQTV